MSATTRSPDTCLDLSLPRTQHSVHLWIAAPANSPDAPPISQSWPAPPQVIYAERRPRLSGPELLAKYGGAAATAAPAEHSRPIADRPATRAAPRDKAGRLRHLWWLALVVADAAVSAGTPVF